MSFPFAFPLIHLSPFHLLLAHFPSWTPNQALVYIQCYPGEAEDGDDRLRRPHVQGLPTKHGLQEVIHCC